MDNKTKPHTTPEKHFKKYSVFFSTFHHLLYFTAQNPGWLVWCSRLHRAPNAWHWSFDREDLKLFSCRMLDQIILMYVVPRCCCVNFSFHIHSVVTLNQTGTQMQDSTLKCDLQVRLIRKKVDTQRSKQSGGGIQRDRLKQGSHTETGSLPN